jgi:hypothetical protein
MRNPDLLRHLIFDVTFAIDPINAGSSKRFYLWGTEWASERQPSVSGEHENKQTSNFIWKILKKNNNNGMEKRGLKKSESKRSSTDASFAILPEYEP